MHTSVGKRDKLSLLGNDYPNLDGILNPIREIGVLHIDMVPLLLVIPPHTCYDTFRCCNR